jgi:hypothetical protein
MALTYDSLNALVQEKVMPTIVDQIGKSTPVMYKLMQKPKSWDGRVIQPLVRSGSNPNAMAYSGADTLNTNASDEFTRASFSPKQYNTSIYITGMDKELYTTDKALLNGVKEKIEVAKQDLIEMFGTDFYASTGVGGDAKKIDGLAALFEADGGAGTTYGGILGGPNGDLEEWYANGGRGPQTGGAFDLEKFQIEIMKAKTNNEKPDMAITTDELFAAMANTWVAPNMRYTDTAMAELGFDNVKVHGVTLVTDDFCPAAGLYILNTKHLWFQVFKNMNFKFIEFDQPINQDTHTAHIRWYGNLVSDKRKAHALVSGITSIA